MRCDNDCTIEGLTEKIESFRENLDEPDLAFMQLNRLRPLLGEAYYKRGILLAERGDVEWAIYDFGQVIRPFRCGSYIDIPSYLPDAYERRAQLYEKKRRRTGAEEDRIMAEKLRNRDV